MATQSPFSLAAGLLGQLGSGLQPPAWIVDELQQRLVLLLNHVLMQEPQAQARLVRHKGRSVRMQWRGFTLPFVATPAGLLDVQAGTSKPDLLLTVTEESPLALVQTVLGGDSFYRGFEVSTLSAVFKASSKRKSISCCPNATS